MLEQITAADRDELVLQQRKLNLGRQIGQTDAARQVNRTYAAAAYGRKAPRMDVKQVDYDACPATMHNFCPREQLPAH